MLRIGRVIKPQLINARLLEDTYARQGVEKPSDLDRVDSEQIVSEALQHKVSSARVLSYAKNDNYEINVDRFHKLLDELQTFSALKELAEWDNEIYLPVKARQERVRQVEITERMSQEKLTSRRTAYLLQFFAKEENYERLSQLDKDQLDKLRREYERDKNIPPKLSQKIKELEVRGSEVLARARQANDFTIIAPLLEEMIELKKQEAKCIGYKYSPYDAMLRQWGEEMTTRDLDKIFAEVKKELIPILKKFQGHTSKLNTDHEDYTYNKKKLMEMGRELLEHMGFDFEAGRIDQFIDPFCSSLGGNDIRIAIDVSEANFYGIISYFIHEGAHGLYAQGYGEEIKGTYLDEPPSYSLDESQARLYDNWIGKGLPFWIYFYPKLQEKFPNQLEDVSLQQFYQGYNTVAISPDSFDSDIEYMLNTIMHYEIERDLVEGKIEVKDLPKVFNERMREFFGMAPKSQAEGGVLFEHHIFTGHFAYAPTYGIGDLYAAQIYEAAKRDIPDLELRIAGGNMTLLRDWLRENIHKHGERLPSSTILRQATGEDLNPMYYIEYVRNKYKNLYPDLFNDKS